MSNDQALRSRQPKGRPSGGEYATEPRLESGIILIDGTTGQQEGIERLIEVTRAAVRHAAMRSDLPFVGEDDMVQETLANIWKNRQAQIEAGKPSVINVTYVYKLARGTVAIAARGAARQEDVAAMKVLSRRRSEFEDEHKRAMTPQEVDDLAAEIRLTWHDPRHKPSADFIDKTRRNREVSFEQPVGDGDRTFGDSLVDRAYEEDSRAFDPDSDAAKVLTGSADLRRARAEAWALMSRVVGGPEPVQGSLTDTVSRRVRTTVEEAGGALEVARAWSEDGRHDDTTDSLFAPFGALDGTGREQAADMLLDNPAYADELWSSAVGMATRRKAGRPLPTEPCVSAHGPQ